MHDRILILLGFRGTAFRPWLRTAKSAVVCTTDFLRCRIGLRGMPLAPGCRQFIVAPFGHRTDTCIGLGASQAREGAFQEEEDDGDDERGQHREQHFGPQLEVGVALPQHIRCAEHTAERHDERQRGKEDPVAPSHGMYAGSKHRSMIANRPSPSRTQASDSA